MALICGFAIPLQWTRSWDHTYVEADTGERWGCFGRDSGGARLDVGFGEVDVANCLSEPNGTAGIRYGLTGVCQQASNRILFETGTSVSRAGGYGLALMAFGPYGRGPWPNAFTCIGPGPHKKQGLAPPGPMDERENNRAVREALMFLPFAESVLGALSLDEMQGLAEVQGFVKAEQASLVDRLDQGVVSRRQYLVLINEVHTQAVKRVALILGEERTTRLLGPARTSVSIIDEEVFLSGG